MKKQGEKLDKVDFAFSFAVVIAILFFLISMLAFMNLLGGLPTLVTIFKEIYGIIGYDLTLARIVLGSIYAFIDAFILAWIFAWIYNLLRKNSFK